MTISGSITVSYSSSPPSTIWSSQVTTAHDGPPSSTFDMDRQIRTHLVQSSNVKQVRGGLSSLFASSSSRLSSSSGMEVLETSCISSSPEDRTSCLGKIRDQRSPVSVLHSPSSLASNAKRLVSPISREAVRSNSYGTHLSDPLSGSSWNTSPILEINRWPLGKHEAFEAQKAAGLSASEMEQDCCHSLNSEDESLDALCLYPPSTDRDVAGPIIMERFMLPRLASEGEVALVKPCDLSRTEEQLPRVSDIPSQHFSTHEPSTESILSDAQQRHKIFLEDLVIRAFNVAERAHQGQLRRNGDIYLTHCLETALILATAGADSTIVAAGLLHDTLDDSNVDLHQLRTLLNDDVADLVVGVSKLSEFSQLARDNNIANDTFEADQLRVMFLAMVDVRVVLIKIADRLHNMRTLEALPWEKRHRIAKETLEIFTPVVNRLGIWRWKAELEDLCFKHLNPEKYQELASRLAEYCREGVIMSAVEKLDQALHQKGLEYSDLSGRSKSLFSIHTKLLKKGCRIQEIYDVRGLRLIVSDKQSCYKALEVVHRIWNHIPGKLKDYIQVPKPNGYQSLHTVVWGEDGLPLEVQIRTLEMHHHAEFGMAAHWRYKENNSIHSSFILQRVEWARWVLTWHSELTDTKVRVSPSKLHLKTACSFPVHRSDCSHATMSYKAPQSDDDPLFVIILKEEKMIVQELPPGSTAADLLLERSLFTNGALSNVITMVNHQTVSIQQKLQMGDLVELVADSSSLGDGEESNIFSGTKVPIDINMSVYREQIRRMYEDTGRCKDEARTSLSNNVMDMPVASLL